MGAYIAFGMCIGCKKPFSFNPNLVPSIRIEGEKEPICRNCVEVANPKRRANGLEEIKILPGAYEPEDEE